MLTNAFTPLGPQSLLSANTTASTGISPPAFGNNIPSTYMLINMTGNNVNVGYGKSAAEASTNAAFPVGNTSGNTSQSFVLPTNAPVVVIKMPFPQPFFSAFCSAANGNCYVVPGG